MKVLVFGIDGGEWSLIEPWAAEGKLPNLARLMARGARGKLRSSFPPMTAAAWTSFATGKHPNKHGIFDFYELAPHSYRIRYTNARARRAPSLWRLLSDAGKRVCVVNVPMTYPPEAVNGYLIAGMDAPGTQSRFTYPADLYADIKQAIGDYRIDWAYLENVKTDDARAAALKQLLEIEVVRGRAMRYLLRRAAWDFAMVVFTATDRVQHYFWKYMDAAHPSYEPDKAVRFGDAILRAYQTVDAQIGQLLEVVDDETTIFVMSDHGFGPIANKCFFLNEWLRENGYLVPRRARQRAGRLLRTLRAAEAVLKETLPSSWRTHLIRLAPWLREKFVSAVFLSDIDWSKTQAFSDDQRPYIWINAVGRFPQGIVPPDEYDRLCDDIIAGLRELKNPDGTPAIPQISRVSGCATSPTAPDIVFSVWHDDAYQVAPSFRRHEGEGVLTTRQRFAGRGEWNACHRHDGIWLASGVPIMQGCKLDASICDLAPTILHLLGLPVPDDMDGRVLTDALTGADNVRYVETDTVTPANSSAYSAEEEAEVAERLRGLGYL
ncbi:MAG: alkaline phosphatase family protein [Abditibacteriales bacterium]|nr:alkaline phosphatase family protein [Abditibacteriales bacterium]MDW8364807.1 alkaline phosphatase family protein [Abditibacteriales bacterium]